MAKTLKAKKIKMESVATAHLRHVRLSAQKARLVIDLVRGKQVEPALSILQFSTKKGAKLVSKLLRSAIANARERGGVDVDKLWVSAGWANEGPHMKRYLPRARGSADMLRKKMSHITISVGERVKA